MLFPAINEHIPEGLQLQVDLENQHHVGGPKAEDSYGGGQDGKGGGESAGGSPQELGELVERKK